MTGWLETSYMARKGVAKGKTGTTHQLDEAKQGKYHYVYGPYAEPVLRIRPGDVVVAETQDAFEGKIKSESDKPSELLNVPFLNPQCGPIAVEGAEKGDALCVHIHSIKPRGPQPIGTTALITEFGGLVATGNTALLNPPLPERVKKMEVTEQGIKFNSKITLPYEPFIGTLGVRGLLLLALLGSFRRLKQAPGPCRHEYSPGNAQRRQTHPEESQNVSTAPQCSKHHQCRVEANPTCDVQSFGMTSVSGDLAENQGRTKRIDDREQG